MEEIEIEIDNKTILVTFEIDNSGEEIIVYGIECEEGIPEDLRLDHAHELIMEWADEARAEAQAMRKLNTRPRGYNTLQS